MPAALAAWMRVALTPSPVVVRDETLGRLRFENPRLLWGDPACSIQALSSESLLWPAEGTDTDPVVWSDGARELDPTMWPYAPLWLEPWEWPAGVLWAEGVLWTEGILWTEGVLWSEGGPVDGGRAVGRGWNALRGSGRSVTPAECRAQT